MFADDTHHQERARKTLRPMLPALCTRQRVGTLSSAAEGVLAAGNAVVVSATMFTALTMCQARTKKPEDPKTIQLRDIQAAVRIDAIRPAMDAQTYLLMSFQSKHPDRKRFNRARYEARKAARAAPASAEEKDEEAPKKKKTKKSTEAAAAAGEASPAKTRKRGRDE